VILQIALDTPLRRVFDYRAPADVASRDAAPLPGVRVEVPFGRRRLIGILVGTAESSAVPAAKLKAAIAVLDALPVFDPVTWSLLLWSAAYYHHPLGEVFAAALPASIRAGRPAARLERSWQLAEAGRRELAAAADRRAPRRRALLEWLAAHGPAEDAAVRRQFSASLLRAMTAAGRIAPHATAAGAAAPLAPQPGTVTPTAAQEAAVRAVIDAFGRFSVHLLHGITGSGKTEVYLRVIAAAAAASAGGQILVLVPEISLTPQLVARFRMRFGDAIAVLHSALPAAERTESWRNAHAGHARIVIGTRSAVFTSMPRLVLIVVDEEHDASYKQQEGFHYSARDLAVRRAQGAGVPIVLGSATPSLESLENALQDRYRKLLLPQRPGSARPPRLALVDLKRHACDQGLSQPAMQAMRGHLHAGGQVLVFLNRRGYAPVLFCNACGWVAPCSHCDARMTLHRGAAQLRCHHCGALAAVPAACPTCRQPLHPLGQGTERVEETLQRLFPDAPLARLDRDTANARGRMQAVLERVHSGEARILVGTQMLTKGHDFPDVSLVVILNADQGLFASDYRATERLAQTIVQVAGRAGRAARAGEVLIQTEFPEHPLLNRLIDSGYESFAAAALAERREARWPPYSRLALLRAEDKDRDRLDAFLSAAAAGARACADPAVEVLGPAPALIARRADHYRAHVLLVAATRTQLQRLLGRWLPLVEGLRGAASLRWSIDVDPLEID
jgi:primosomal protein N' (replication factor Y)